MKLLAHPAQEQEPRPPRVPRWARRGQEQKHEDEGQHGLEHFLQVVAKLSLGNGPGSLVVALEGSDLLSHQGGGSTTVVVDAPVVDARTKV